MTHIINCITSTKKSLLFVAYLLAFNSFNLFAQTSDTLRQRQQNTKMDWWQKARFGMFIHWGVYAVPAGRFHGKMVEGFYEGHVVPSAGEWIMHDAKISREEYQQFAKQFNPTHFDPDAWVTMAKEAGMKYIVITSKHHDGFALFETKASDWNVVQATPYGKDIIKQLADACRKQNMKLGLYYSQANDWNNVGGAVENGAWDSTQKGSMDVYIKNIAVPQVKEILSNYGDVAELWWDVPTDMTKERADAFLPLLAMQPNIITNNRLGGGYQGDIATPEQYIPATGIPGNWETCMTMNETWGFKEDDHKWKSSKELIRNLVDIASKGGNYLLNVGPDAQGEFPGESIARLKDIGKWMNVNGEAIYGTNASPFKKINWGRCTKKTNSGVSTILYLHVFEWPKNGVLEVPALNSKIKSANLLFNGSNLPTKNTKEGLVIQVPKQVPDTMATVIKLVLQNALTVGEYDEMANENGSFILDAALTELHNDAATKDSILVKGNEQPYVVFSNDARNFISWKIKVKKPGTYTIKAMVSATNAPGKLSIETGNQKLVVAPMQTTEGAEFTDEILGKITIAKAGIYQLKIKPVAQLFQPIRLQQLVLQL